MCYNKNMKKIFILLFPQTEYISQFDDPKLFNECIEKRYIQNGYEFWVAKYKESDLGFVSLNPDKVIDADITFKQSTPKFCKDWRYADFKQMAKTLSLSEDDSVVLSGFHCYDCVEKFANEIYKLNPNITIDADLTEMFWGRSGYDESWRIEKYNPNLKLERMIETEDFLPSEVDSFVKKYSHPIWNVSKEVLDQMKKFKSSNEKELQVQ